jgi:hypothetical protein
MVEMLHGHSVVADICKVLMAYNYGEGVASVIHH